MQESVVSLRGAPRAVALVVALWLCAPTHADTPDIPAAVPQAAPALTQPQVAAPAAFPAPAPSGLARWLDPSTAPFIPIPEIDTDPNTGTTIGLIPTVVETNDNNEITRIYAPDVFHAQYFGYGARARVYSFPSTDTTWSVVAGFKRRIESEFDGEFASGIRRDSRWSTTLSAIYDRSGSPHFYGIGNESQQHDVSGYIDQQKALQALVGFNFNHAWQLALLLRTQTVKILPWTITGLPPLTRRFDRLVGIGITSQFEQRISLTYDTRDDPILPTRGMKWVAYGGLASRQGVLNDSMYNETGTDFRDFWNINPATVLATHAALRYVPTSNRVPFWALSSLGGDQNVVGGEMALRGFGEGRFYDRNAVSASVELRRRVASFNAVSTEINLELTPFIDSGRVFSATHALPLTQLHTVYGLGLRAVARPSVVGYLDVGYGSEGMAVFTGIGYPF